MNVIVSARRVRRNLAAISAEFTEAAQSNLGVCHQSTQWLVASYAVPQRWAAPFGGIRVEQIRQRRQVVFVLRRFGR